LVRVFFGVCSEEHPIYRTATEQIPKQYRTKPEKQPVFAVKTSQNQSKPVKTSQNPSGIEFVIRWCFRWRYSFVALQKSMFNFKF
jgi:hypothetical protein